MTVLTDAATQAWQDAQATAQATVEAERKALRDAAKAEVGNVIAPLTWAEAGLSFVHTDMANRLVVASDGTVSLSADQAEGGVWRVRLVEQVDGGWTRRSGALGSLAELGEALTGGG